MTMQAMQCSGERSSTPEHSPEQFTLIVCATLELRAVWNLQLGVWRRRPWASPAPHMCLCSATTAQSGGGPVASAVLAQLAQRSGHRYCAPWQPFLMGPCLRPCFLMYGSFFTVGTKSWHSLPGGWRGSLASPNPWRLAHATGRRLRG